MYIRSTYLPICHKVFFARPRRKGKRKDGPGGSVGFEAAQEPWWRAHSVITDGMAIAAPEHVLLLRLLAAAWHDEATHETRMLSPSSCILSLGCLYTDSGVITGRKMQSMIGDRGQKLQTDSRFPNDAEYVPRYLRIILP